MTTDPFTEAARIIDAHRENERWVGDGVKIECVCGHASHATYDFSGPITEDKNNHRDAERMHAAHVAQVLTAQEPDDAGPHELDENTPIRNLGYYRSSARCKCGHEVIWGEHDGDAGLDEAWRVHLMRSAVYAFRTARRDEDPR